MGSLTKLEMETTINWNAAEDEASVYTASPSVRRRLEKRFGRPPDRIMGPGAEWVVPKRWITLPRRKEKRSATAGQAENLRAGRKP